MLILKNRKQSDSGLCRFRIPRSAFKSPQDIAVCFYSGGTQPRTWVFTQAQWFGIRSSGIIPLDELKTNQSRHLYSETKDIDTIKREEDQIRTFLQSR